MTENCRSSGTSATIVDEAGDRHTRSGGELSSGLVNCYELGRPSFALGSVAAWLKRAGHQVKTIDLALGAAADREFEGLDLVIVSVPMHTALRLGLEAAAQARRASPGAHICFIGLYAALFASELLAGHADSIASGEIEPSIDGLARQLVSGGSLDEVPGIVTRVEKGAIAQPHLRRVPLLVPDRSTMPSLTRHTALLGPGPGQRRLAGYTEASRGCKYRCRHCPVVPVYDGRFFAVPLEVVRQDIRQQVDAGAQHISFGDPDFMNGITHAMRVARALHEDHPEVTFDVTVKVEHVLMHRQHFGELAQLGCLFVVSAFESLSDRVLAELDKGHTRQDILAALAVLRSAGIPVRPSLVPFTPWATLRDYLELVDFVFHEGLTECVDPIQLAIRLLIPRGSALLASAHERPWLGEYDPEALGYRWWHPDPAMDALHAEVSACAERSLERGLSNRKALEQIRGLAYARAGETPPLLPVGDEAPPVPRMSEGWFCCAEPTKAQLQKARGPCI